ncbi:MAG: cytotoxic translational repressor of toxin-antitoxin stability system [Acidimicrobiia bacterium]
MRPLPYSALRTFVETEGWTPKGTARGTKKQGDHERYTLALADGTVLATRISHGGGQYDDPSMVSHILRDELHVSEPDFWTCVEQGVKPPRPQPESIRGPGNEIPYDLMRNLVRKVGMAPADIERLTKAEAVQAWQDYLSRGGT